MWIHVDFWFSNVIAPFQSYYFLAPIFKTLMYLVWNTSLGIGMFAEYCVNLCSKVGKLLMSIVFCLWENDTDYFFKVSSRGYFFPNNKWVILDTFKWLFHVYLGFPLKCISVKCTPGGTTGEDPTYQCRRHERQGLILGSGRSPGGGNGNPPQYYCLENLMDRGAWGLQSMGPQRVGGNWATNTHTEMN